MYLRVHLDRWTQGYISGSAGTVREVPMVCRGAWGTGMLVWEPMP